MARAGRRVLRDRGGDGAGRRHALGGADPPGHVHDVCSAIHPLGAGLPGPAGPAARRPRARVGAPAAPRSPTPSTAAGPRCSSDRSTRRRWRSATDGAAYLGLMTPLVADGERIVDAVLSPLSMPPVRALPSLARFGLSAISPADRFARRRFATEEAQALMAGLSAHSVLSLGSPGTAGFGLVLGLLGHLVGWPMAKGGSQAIADALVSLLLAEGGEVVVGHPVRIAGRRARRPRRSCSTCRPARCSTSAGSGCRPRYRRRLNRFRYGAAVWKVDWALDGPIPWTAPGCARAGTVHVCGHGGRGGRGRAGRAARPPSRAPDGAARPAVAVRPDQGAGGRAQRLGATATCPTARPST